MRTPEETEALLDKLELFMDEYNTANANFEREGKKKAWSDKYGERLSPYADKLKALNGDDFDIMVASMDEYDNDYSDMKDDDYVESLVQNIESTLAKLSAALAPAEEKAVEEGADEEKPAEDNTSDAACKVAAVVADKVAEDEEESKPDTSEGPDKAAAAEIEVADEEDDKDDFVKELEEYKKAHPRG